MFKLTNIVVILFFTTFVNIITTSTSWRRRKAKHGRFFALGMTGLTLWTFASSLDYAAVPIALKIFFAKMEVVGYQSALALFLVSIALYAGYEPWLKKIWITILLVAIPTSNIVLAWTNDLHGWLWSNFSVSAVGDNVVVFEHGPGFTWTALTTYLMVGIITAILLQVAIRGTVVLRKQARLLLLALLVPVASNLLYLFDVFHLPGIDWSSISFSITGMLFLSALYGTRFLEVVPIARNALIEQMDDGVLVLDSHNYLADCNPAARGILGLEESCLWKPADVALAHYSEIVSFLKDSSGKIAAEMSFDNGVHIYDMRLTYLRDQRSDAYGRLVVLRNISDRMRMEDTLRQSKEKFFKAFHSSPDAVLITRLRDGVLIDVNNGFCRLSGYGREEALGNSSIALNLWSAPQERERVVAELHQTQRIEAIELDFRSKSGKILNCLYSAQLIQLDGNPHILSVVHDITERKRAKEAIERGNKLLAAVLDTLPVGVCLTDETGHYRMMNDAYCAIYEYQRAEMLGQHYGVIMPSDQLALANKHYERLLDGDVGIPVERKRQRKDGSIVYIEAANALLENIEGQKMIITTVRDITERNRTEEIVRMRLRLWEYAATHSIDELMQKALDEIGSLIDSPIGFYHFVNEDQETLSLQAWSTRTLAEFCKAEGKGMHYPISEAGVWVDCVRERKPVIHNDYSTLSHRKGMPAGHAEVMRELVVPTLRNDRIVAILGVGNKPKDYDEKDIEIVSYIADIVWTIVEQKRSNEQIIQLNAKLEQLAMTDELTGLFNRRLFFERGTEEIQRSQRYKTQLSLLMMDIDDFKSVNDTYGHDAGDRMLCCVAKTLQRCKRSVDLLARLGGEEFGILLPNTDEKDAMKLAERLRLEVERATCSNQDHMTGVTMSIGVATRGEEMMSIDDLLKNADAAMYQAKNLGRNKVVSYS